MLGFENNCFRIQVTATKTQVNIAYFVSNVKIFLKGALYLIKGKKWVFFSFF